MLASTRACLQAQTCICTHACTHMRARTGGDTHTQPQPHTQKLPNYQTTTTTTAQGTHTQRRQAQSEHIPRTTQQQQRCTLPDHCEECDCRWAVCYEHTPKEQHERHPGAGNGNTPPRNGPSRVVMCFVLCASARTTHHHQLSSKTVAMADTILLGTRRFVPPFRYLACTHTRTRPRGNTRLSSRVDGRHYLRRRPSLAPRWRPDRPAAGRASSTFMVRSLSSLRLSGCAASLSSSLSSSSVL